MTDIGGDEDEDIIILDIITQNLTVMARILSRRALQRRLAPPFPSPLPRPVMIMKVARSSSTSFSLEE